MLICGLDVKRRKGKLEWQERGPKIEKDHYGSWVISSEAERASRWLDRGRGISSWERGNKSSRRGLADRDSDPRSTVQSVAYEFVSSCPHKELCPLKSPSKIKGAGN
ncbi:hypothetical protein TNCV_177771 [Trichonephila clavipes]|nr:hypothetical protein TNCV_177771 [Trichonephila clavipes]